MTVRYTIIDEPTEVGRNIYESAVGAMTAKLKMLDGISAVYQIGSVSSPGLSDLDMVAIFADNSACHADPRAGLDDAGRYLFVHDLYGATRSEFQALNRFSLFHNYELVWGDDIRAELPESPDTDQQILKTQIALEFLVRMYINMTMQKAYGVIKLRGFLLHSKAIAYDLEFLGVNEGELHDLTMQCIEARNHWFRHSLSRPELSRLFDDYFDAITNFLNEQLIKHSLYLPERDKYILSRPVELKCSDRLQARRSGLRLPRALSSIGPRYFNLQNRINRFAFDVPFKNQNIPTFLDERFRAVDAARRYHKDKLPHFAVLMSSLAVQ